MGQMTRRKLIWSTVISLALLLLSAMREEMKTDPLARAYYHAWKATFLHYCCSHPPAKAGTPTGEVTDIHPEEQ